MRDRVSRGLLVAGALGLVSAAGAQPRFAALGDLSGGSFRSRAEGISGDGSTVVGYSFVAGNLIEAFRWTEGGGMVGLGKLGSAQSESAALAVNRDGLVIAGQADTNPPFVRQPALGRVGRGSRRVFDFLCFQNAFVQGDPFADCTGDGSFDVLDFLCFQNAFAIGCP